MFLYLSEIIEQLRDDSSGLEVIGDLLAYIRKYHRRLSTGEISVVLDIVIEVSKRDLVLDKDENYLVNNFEYFMYVFNNLQTREFDKFKNKILSSGFSLEDLVGLLEYIRTNLDRLRPELDFILRIPERIIKANGRLNYINEFNPSKKKWANKLIIYC